MRLATRLFLYGAALPALATAGALLVAGEAFRFALLQSLDRALLAQAAVESVSLFDQPGGRAHLHMATSPLEEAVRPFAPTGYLYGPDGRLLVRHPPLTDDAVEPPRLPGAPSEPPELSTIETDGGRMRELVVTVRHPQGAPYLLRLSASLAQLEASVATYRRVTLTFALLLALVLLAVQWWQARRLARRLGRITGHLARVREGSLDDPPPDHGRDEVADLRAVLAEAVAKLRDARATQERLIADAAHELRTPLTLMRTGLDLALRRERSPDELRTALAETRQEVDRLAALASRLLDLAAVGRGAWDRAQSDLHRIAEEAVEAARGVAEERGILIAVEGVERAVGAFHGGAVRQAIDNLLSNALRYAPRGSTVRVIVRRANERWELAVADEGPGIPPEERQAVFDPFHRIPGAPGGTGLGLAIVQEIARRHGGEAFVADGGRGATVVLALRG